MAPLILTVLSGSYKPFYQTRSTTSRSQSSHVRERLPLSRGNRSGGGKKSLIQLHSFSFLNKKKNGEHRISFSKRLTRCHKQPCCVRGPPARRVEKAAWFPFDVRVQTRALTVLLFHPGVGMVPIWTRKTPEVFVTCFHRGNHASLKVADRWKHR